MKLSDADKEFVKHYDDSKYAKPSVTADMAIFSEGEELKLLLIRRGRPPFQNQYALPGGFVNPDESVDDAARRELKEETGVDCGCLEQLRTFSTPGRDPRRWVITCAYLALVDQKQITVQAGDDAKDAEWFRVELETVPVSADEVVQPDKTTQADAAMQTVQAVQKETAHVDEKTPADAAAQTGETMPADNARMTSGAAQTVSHHWLLKLHGKQQTIQIPFREDMLPGAFSSQLSLETEDGGLAFDHSLIVAYAVMRLRQRQDRSGRASKTALLHRI